VGWWVSLTQQRKEKHSGNGKEEAKSNGHLQSPYGCHAVPDIAKSLHPKLNSLPNEPLMKGEQYFLDLAGNIQKGPVGVQTCYCGPLLHRLECQLAKDKQEILQRLDSAHLRLDAKIDGLERKTQQQLHGLQRTVDSLNLESSAAGLQRIRNSIVLADSSGRRSPPGTVEKRSPGGANSAAHSPLSNEVQYTLDKLGLDVNNDAAAAAAVHVLRHRLAHAKDAKDASKRRSLRAPDPRADESEESEDGDSAPVVHPPPALTSQQKVPMLSDSRYELYDYPPAIAKPYTTFSQESNGALNYQLRHLPLPRYHLDPVMENGSGSGDAMPLPSSTTSVAMTPSGHENKTLDAVPYDRHYSANDLGILRFHDDRDRHNDSGYSTRPGESSQGPSPSLSGPAESMEGDGMRIAAGGIRADRHFHSHFTRDLAQTLPVSATSTSGINFHQRVRFAIPSPDEQTERNGVTISSSSLV